LNPDGSVYLLSLYNPFADLKGNELTFKIVADWNDTLTATARSFPQVTVIPVYDLFWKHPKSFLYSDHFHPNQQGYRHIADRLWQVMTLESPEVGKSHAEQADS
jgi:lysophospholipase L1-like esterase